VSGPSDWPLPANGVRYVVPVFLQERLAQGPLTRGLYPHAMGYYPRAKGHRVHRHEHDDHLLLFCAGGQGQLSVAGYQHPVGKGDLMMLPRGVQHGYFASARDPWTLYWVHFAGTDVDAFWRHLDFQAERPVRHVGAAVKLVADFETLLEVRSTGFREGPFILAANQLREMLALLGLLVARQNHRPERGFNIEAIHALMEENLHGQLDLATLAQAAEMSRHGFCRRYKAITGDSPYQHFLHLKMERACYLLDITEQTVGAIAESLGYDDAYYFSRAFRKIMGMSPSHYRATRHG
jgi:AraC family transcriptional regulator, arabinose operon regulatory protein